MKQKRVFLMSAPSGAGKSTFIKERIFNYGGIHISRDKVRFDMVSEDEDYFAHEDEVFNEWIRQCQEAIDGDVHRDIYIDATHISDRSRAKTINCLNINRDEVMLICVRVVVPVEVCKYRNSLREGRARVPDEVISSMYKNFSYPSKRYSWAPKFDEIWEVNAEGILVNERR